jgi:hypothetical protein
MAALRKLAISTLGLALMASSGFGYYHYVHYASAATYNTPIQEKYDLAVLPNNTVSVFVSDIGPTPLLPGDSFAAVLSEIQMAVGVWNAVDTSTLRVNFGGLSSVGTPQATPAIQVEFGDVPPGLLAFTSNTHTNITSGVNGTFVPITASVLVLKRDLSQRPSSGELFFLTVVHELGHALGLQHTETSAAMSVEVTRATTKSKPLGPDDIAGISVLYPAQNFSSRFGSITGRVTLSSGSGVALASVVAISPNGPAVSALTNPDGSYRIDGLAPGSYLMYVHPLPPGVQGPPFGPADVVYPVDSNGQAITSAPLFQTQFYPATRDWTQALSVPVTVGAVTSGINFSVQSRSSALQVYDVTTYSYPTPTLAVKPAYLPNFNSQGVFIATGSGLVTAANTAPVPGLGVSVVGSISVSGLGAYAPPNAYTVVGLALTPFSGNGPRHLIFTLNNDLYVLPSGVNLTAAAPPTITSVTPGVDATGAPTVTITGTNLTSSTLLYFDGLPAAIRSIDTVNQVIVATPPPGAAGYQATVAVFNTDGQSSLFAAAPPIYSYAPGGPAAITVTPASLPAGVEAMIDVEGVNNNFTAGSTTLGFGSSDVVVKRIAVLSPTHLIASVAVNANAPATLSQISVFSGFQVVNQPFAFQIQPANPRLPVLSSQLVNPVTGVASVYAGGYAVMNVTNLPATATATSLALTVGGVSVPILGVANGQITFQVPLGLATGPAIVTLQDGVDSIYPVVASAINNASGVLITPNNPAHPGDLLNVFVTGLGTGITASQVQLSVGGVIHAALGNPQPSGNGYVVQFILSSTDPTGAAVQVIFTVSGTSSSQVYILPIQSF